VGFHARTGDKMMVWELTTNDKDGFAKWYVRGIKSFEEAKDVALKGFGKRFMSEKLYSYYDDFPSPSGTDWGKKSLTVKEFLVEAKKVYGNK
jgi:hypothetical protein